MRLKRPIAIILAGLVLVLFLASFNGLNSNSQPVYPQVYNYGGIIQKSSNFTYSTNTTEDFRIQVPHGKMIGEINITLNSIIAPNNTITPESVNGSELQIPSNGPFLAMCFNITNSAYLDSVSIRLRTTNALLTTLNITIFGADLNGQPATFVTDKEFTTSEIIDNWFSITMNHDFLNKTSVNNGVFFVCITQENIPQNKIYWYSDQDNLGNYGPAYRSEAGSWILLDQDFNLKLNISANKTGSVDVPNPNDINLTINGANPDSSTYGSGFYQLYYISPVGPYAYFDVSSPWDEMPYASNLPVNFIVEANYTFVDAPSQINLIPLILGLTGTYQGDGFLLFFGGGGLVVAAIGLVSGFVVVRTRRRNYFFNALRKLSRIMVLNSVSGVNVFDFPLSEDESEIDASLIAASVSAVGVLESEADTRGSKIVGRREWFSTDKRVFFNLGFSESVADESERSIFDGWWIGGIFDEPLTDDERNQVRGVIRVLGNEAVRLAALDSAAYNNFVNWEGKLKVFREFFLQVMIDGFQAKGLSLDKVKQLRIQGIQKSKMVLKLTEMESVVLIRDMLSALENFESAVVCLNVGREMWIKDVKNFLGEKQVKKLEKGATDKEALLYSTIKGNNMTRIQAAFLYVMLLMKKLASMNLKLDVIFFGLPPDYKVSKARSAPSESKVESKIVLENVNPSDPKVWSSFTQTLFDIVSRGEAIPAVKLDYESIIDEVDSCIKEHEKEGTAKIILTAGGIDTPKIIKLVKSEKILNTYTFLLGAPLEEMVRTPAQFIPIPAVSEENIKPFTEKRNR